MGHKMCICRLRHIVPIGRLAEWGQRGRDGVGNWKCGNGDADGGIGWNG